MAEDEFLDEENKEDEEAQKQIPSASPQQKKLLKKQSEFELGEKKREVEEISEGKKRNKWEIIFRWLILLLVATGLGLLTKWLLF